MTTPSKDDFVSAAILRMIKDRAARDYPTDHILQQFQIEKQVSDYVKILRIKISLKTHSIPEAILKDICAKAAADFPDDFSMQLFRIEQQIVDYLPSSIDKKGEESSCLTTPCQRVAKAHAEAISSYCRAAVSGDAVALNRLNEIANTGDAESQYEMGNVYRSRVSYDDYYRDYEDGEGHVQDSNEDEAANWYTKAAEQGHSRALNDLFLLAGYYPGYWIDSDGDQREDGLYFEGKNGSAVAQFNLAEMYEQGSGVEKNICEASELYKWALENGCAQAQFLQGLRYENGQGTDKSIAEAIEWYLKAAQQGHLASLQHLNAVADKVRAEDQYALGSLLVSNGLLKQNYGEAIKWLQRAAEQDHIEAQCELGMLYMSGKGESIPRDSTEAVKWYRRAADNGNPEALYILGMCFQEGNGMPRDYAEAVRCYNKAADKGSPEAKCRLGICYQKGEVVPQDNAEAARWFQQAAYDGLADAQYRLGMCYLEGKGLPQDYTIAAKWFIAASRQGHAEGAKEFKALADAGKW